MFGAVATLAGVIVIALCFPLVMLLLGLPVVLLVRLINGIVQRL